MSFVKGTVTLKFGDKTLQTNTFISEGGVFQAFEIAKNPELLGQSVITEFMKLTFKGRFVKEFTAKGAYYNIKFLPENDPLARGALVEIIRKHQLQPPPWERKYPRFHVQMVADLGIVAPVHMIVKSGPFFHFPMLINFTLGGTLVETQGTELADVQPRQIYPFDLQLNDGSVIKGLDAKIVRVNEDLIPSDRRLFRQIAFEMAQASQNNPVYKTLIRNCLQRLTGK